MHLAGGAGHLRAGEVMGTRKGQEEKGKVGWKPGHGARRRVCGKE